MVQLRVLHCEISQAVDPAEALMLVQRAVEAGRGSDSNGAKSHVKGRCWDRLASQDLSPSVSQGTIWRYVAVDRRLGYA